MNVKQPFRAQLRVLPAAATPDNFEVLDTAAKVANANNIGEMVRPNDKTGEGSAAPDAKQPSKKKAASLPRSTSVMKRLTTDVPDYLLKEVHARALENGTTLRYVVLDALRKAHFTIKPEDMQVDGRRDA